MGKRQARGPREAPTHIDGARLRAFADGALPEDVRGEVETHLAWCSSCSLAVDAYRDILAERGNPAAYAEENAAAREMIARAEHATAGALRLLGVPIKLSDTPGAVRSAPPTLGQHTEAVLSRDLGMSAHEVRALRDRGVI